MRKYTFSTPDIDREIGVAAALIQTLHRSVVVKEELTKKTKLSIYVLTLWY